MLAAPRPASDQPASLHIVVNGEPAETTARTLADLLTEAGYDVAKVATARNGVFVAVGARAGTVIERGDRIEIVAPRAGG